MSKLLLFIAFLAITALATVHHHHHKKHHRENGTLTDVPEHIIHGKITCQGKGVDYLRPYLHSYQFPRTIITVCQTLGGGMFRLTTGTMFDTMGMIQLLVRHQCPVFDRHPQKNCAVPYYTTNIYFNLVGQEKMIKRDIELYEMAEDTTPECL